MEFTVNLDLPPSERWLGMVSYGKQIDELVACYLKDFEDSPIQELVATLFSPGFLPQSYLDEVSSIASLCSYEPVDVLTVNLYYDLLKSYFGCTAFATHRAGKVFHARNLDWWTENELLSKNTIVFDYQRGGRTVFKAVGWPGFIGVLSGIRPGAFAVTLNAVLSEDSPIIATPISFFLRDVLERAMDFESAKDLLEYTEIASDCLLLLSGTTPDEMIVIERTPTRFATRKAEKQSIVVANEYLKLDNKQGDSSVLQATSKGRYARACKLLKAPPKTLTACFDILNDKQIKMGITVQQMVFEVLSGNISIQLPVDSSNRFFIS